MHPVCCVFLFALADHLLLLVLLAYRVHELEVDAVNALY